jgi:hypothetical protein
MKEVYAFEKDGILRPLSKEEKFEGRQLHIEYSGYKYYATPGPELSPKQLRLVRKHYDDSVIRSYENSFVIFRDMVFLESEIIMNPLLDRWILVADDFFSGISLKGYFDGCGYRYWKIGTYYVSVKG